VFAPFTDNRFIGSRPSPPNGKNAKKQLRMRIRAQNFISWVLSSHKDDALFVDFTVDCAAWEFVG
jgi:hypothetical protein